VKIIAALLLTTLFAVNPKPRLQSPEESAAREMLTNFATGRFAEAMRDFNDQLRPQMTPEVLKQVKAQLDAEAGPFLLIKEVHQRRQEGFPAIELIAKFEKGSLSVLVVFDALDRIAAVYFNPVAPPKVDKVLEDAARDILANFNAGRFEEVIKPFDANMRAQLPLASLVQLSANVTNVFGKFQSVTAVTQRIEKGYTVIDLTLAYSNAPMTFRVGFDSRNRVTALHIQPYREE